MGSRQTVVLDFTAFTGGTFSDLITLAGALHRKGPNRAQPPLVVMSADFIQLKGQGGGGFGWDRLSSPRTHAAHARSRTHAHTRRSTLPPYPVGTST